MKAEPIRTSITEPLPELPLASWRETLETLHMWMQVVGKVQLELTPKVNHWWNVTFLVTSRGLTTHPIPHGLGSFEVAFDFLDHELSIEVSDGNGRALPLRPQSVAEFYQQFMAALASLGINVKIWTMPCEIPNPIRFETDHVHAAYDADAAQRFWRILLWADNVFAEFRSRFIGKVSPVHFFWGSFDLAVTRFSGRTAPERPGADSDHARSLFPRSKQRRLLARRRRYQRAGILFLRRSSARRLCPTAGAPQAGLLSLAARRVPADV